MQGILWLLVWAAFFYFMMRFGCGSHMVHGGHGGHGGHGSGNEGDTSPGGHGSHGMQGKTGSRTKDPVCGMEVAPDSGYSRMYQGREYRFCSRNCLDQFDRDPAKYTR